MSNSALEEYYKRTVAGNFLGTYRLSLAFEDLVRQMVEPSIATRMPSCAKGLNHPFFNPRPLSVVGMSMKPSMSKCAHLSCCDTARTVPPQPAVGHATEIPPPKAVTGEKQGENTVFKAPLTTMSPNRPRANTSSKVPQPVKTATKPVASPKVEIKPLLSSEAASFPKINESRKKIAVSASPARKHRKDIKIFKDPAPPQTSTSNINARGLNSNQAPGVMGGGDAAPNTKPELRPLLLRADSAQGVRAPAKPFVDGNPMMSTPTKKFGQAANAWAVSNNSSVISSRTLKSNASTRSSVTPKKTTVNRSSSVAQTRDSKELRSPESIKSQKSLASTRDQNQENVLLVSQRSPAAVAKEPAKSVATFFKNKSTLSACEYTRRSALNELSNQKSPAAGSQNIKEQSPPPFSLNTIPLQSAFDDTATLQVEPVIEKERKFKLSKKRPSMKSQKSCSALSFSSLSSSFKGTRGKSLDGRQHLNRDLESDYAIVERDGRVSFDGCESWRKK